MAKPLDPHEKQVPSDDSLDVASLDVVEELVAECVERWAEEGESALTEVCERHPSVAAELQEQFELLREAGVLDDDDEAVMPERLGKYRLVRRLGGGGMGVVFLAVEEPAGRTVAIKLVRPDQAYFVGSRKRFQREMQAISRLQHPSIVPVYSLEESGGVPFFVMENIEGCTLAEVLEDLEGKDSQELSAGDLAAAVVRRTPGEVTPPDAETLRRNFGDSWSEACLGLCLQIAEALDHAHRRGVMHRDVKPSNIMVTPDGRALLLDFGLASSQDSDELTKTGAHIGSLPYMAPEQLRAGSIDARVDIYALGVTMYELLARVSPFLCGSAEATRAAVLDASPQSLRGINPQLSWEDETVVLTAMSAEPSQRYATAADLARDLHNVLEGRSIVARRPSTLRRARRLIARHPTLSVFLSLFGVVSLLLVGIAIDRGNSLRAIRDQRAKTVAATNQRDQFATERDQFSEERTRLFLSFGLESLLAREPYLWPARPEVVSQEGGMDDWISEAKSVRGLVLSQVVLLEEVRGRGRQVDLGDRARRDVQVAGRLLHRDLLHSQLAALRRRDDRVESSVRRALETELQALEHELNEQWSWSFDDTFDTQWNAYLSHLAHLLRQLYVAEEKVERRSRWAMSLGPRCLQDAAELWARTRREIAEDPRYSFDLAPQWGLVPLGRDPESGVFEFTYLPCADTEVEERLPRRDAETGRLIPDPRAGLVMVLIPPTRGGDDGVELPAFFVARQPLSPQHWARADGDPEAPSVRVLRRLDLAVPTEAQLEAVAGWLPGATASVPPVGRPNHEGSTELLRLRPVRALDLVGVDDDDAAPEGGLSEPGSSSPSPLETPSGDEE